MGLISIKVYNQDAAEIKAILSVVLEKLDSQNLKITEIMANLQDFQSAQARQNEAILNIAADIQRQVEQLQKGNLTEAEEQSVLDGMLATATQLEAIATIVPEPIVEEPTDEETDTEG